MTRIDNHDLPRFKLSAVFLCSILLLPVILGCGVLNRVILPTATPTASSTYTQSATPAQPLTSTPTITSTPTEIPPLCGGPRVMFILLIGSDHRNNNYNAGLADAIRLVRVDFVEPRVQLLAFPRDLYVEIPGIESHHGITHGKLNQAYLYGNPGFGYFDAPGLGPGLLSLTLEHNFGAHADHYVAVNLQTFSRVIDALGGIDIYLPYAVDGRVRGSKDANRYFPAGSQHLNGYRAMLLARLRPNGDFQRVQAQTLILRAVAEKLLSPSMLPRLPELIEAFRGSLQTDLGPAEIGQLTCLAALMDTKKIEFFSFPENLFTLSRVQDPILGNTSVYYADFEVLKSYVEEFENGSWLASEDELEPGLVP